LKSHGNFRSILSIFLLFSCSVFFGCDQIKTLTEYFSPKKATPASAVSPAVPKPTPSSNNAQAPMDANVLAKVGNWTLTVDDFNARLKNLKEAIPEYDITDPESKKLVLDELVRQELLVIDAEKSGLSNKKDIAEAVEEFRKTILVRELVTQLTEKVDVTDQEAEDFYNQNIEFMREPTQWHVREIVANTEQGANDILKELLNGKDFATMAQERSIGKTASKGGDLEMLIEPPFPEMATSNVFKGPEGFYIIKLEEKKEGVKKELAEIKDQIKEGLKIRKQQDALMDHINKLQEQANVYRNDELLKGQN